VPVSFLRWIAILKLIGIYDVDRPEPRGIDSGHQVLQISAFTLEEEDAKCGKNSMCLGRQLALFREESLGLEGGHKGWLES